MGSFCLLLCGLCLFNTAFYLSFLCLQVCYRGIGLLYTCVSFCYRSVELLSCFLYLFLAGVYLVFSFVKFLLGIRLLSFILGEVVFVFLFFLIQLFLSFLLSCLAAAGCHGFRKILHAVLFSLQIVLMFFAQRRLVSVELQIEICVVIDIKSIPFYKEKRIEAAVSYIRGAPLIVKKNRRVDKADYLESCFVEVLKFILIILIRDLDEVTHSESGIGNAV